MALNTSISELDAVQLQRRMFDEANDAQRVIVTDATSFQIELSHSDGDSVYTYSPQPDPATGTQTPATVNNAEVITPQSAVGFSKVVIFGEGLTGVSVAGAVKVQVSPADSGSSWADLSLSLTSGTAGNTTVTVPTNILARRVRVVSTTAPTGGNVTYSLLLSNG